MCPFCIGTAAWAAAGVLSAGGLGVLAAVVHRGRGDVCDDPSSRAPSAEESGRRNA